MNEREYAPIDAEFEEQQQGGALTALKPGGGMNVSSRAGIITAQKVALPRNEAQIRNKIKIYAAMAGEDWYYRWTVKDRKTNKTETIEGPSVDCAESVAALVGNAQVDCDVREEKDYYIFLARYVDLETGFTLTRPFKQRKSQKVGKMDAERQDDIIFQIGASKATRNVICNAIKVFTNYAFEQAKQNLIEEIGKKLPGTRAKVVERLRDLQVPLIRVEKLYARKIDEFTAPDLAKVVAEIKAISEGMATVDDCFPPSPEELAEHMKQAEGAAQQGTASGPKAESEKAVDPTNFENFDWEGFLDQILPQLWAAKSLAEILALTTRRAKDLQLIASKAPTNVQARWAKQHAAAVEKLKASSEPVSSRAVAADGEKEPSQATAGPPAEETAHQQQADDAATKKAEEADRILAEKRERLSLIPTFEVPKNGKGAPDWLGYHDLIVNELTTLRDADEFAEFERRNGAAIERMGKQISNAAVLKLIVAGKAKR